MNLHRLVREPLLHFLALGLVFFLLYDVVGRGEATDRQITISAGRVAEIGKQYQALWGVPPSPAQLVGLIDSEVRSEVLYREGLAAGLDRDDPVIKRRIRQKIEVMAEEENGETPPGDAELAAYLAARPAKFTRPAVISFDQVYFNPQGRATPASVAAAKARLAAGASPAGIGEPSLLPARVTAADTDSIARDFGSDFAAALTKLPIGQWQGPIGSGVGVHLVRVTALTPAHPPTLAEVRDQVQREWENDRRIAASEASYRRMRERYTVVVEGRP